MFETGDFNIHPQILEGVLAMSNNDSIFVRSDLISDPHVHGNMLTIHRVLGNLGRPETAFLVPPSNLRMEGYVINSWRMVNHTPFDGKFENNFNGTSLHLSFTDFELPVDVGRRGLRDTLVVLLEAVVSVIDRNKHIGDLDLNAYFKDDHGDGYHAIRANCNHEMGQIDLQPPDDLVLNKPLVSIDSWPEFFDPPRETSIFRAYGNWQVRLAAAAASVRKRNKVGILPQNSTCVKCLATLVNGERVSIVIA